jgi:O-antigen/teichoic acid export membrane protein
VVPLLTNQFIRVTFPFASERAALGDRAALRTVFLGGTRVTLAVSLPLTVTLAVAGGDILSLWVGEEYREYAYLVTLLAVNGLLDTASYPGTNVLMAIDRHRRIAWTALADGLLNLALSIVLALSIGLAGVALATVISTVVVLGVSVVPYTTRTLGVSVADFFRAALVPLLLPTAAFLAALLLLRTVVDGDSFLALLAAIVPAGLVYAAAYVTLSAPAGEREVYRAYAAAFVSRLSGSRR